jgi:general stress protein 26
MTVWIATTPVTRKVAEIRRDPRVTLSYFDSGSMSYVTLLGRAAIVTDAAEKAAHWKDEWAKLYKDKNRGDDYLLIRVKPSRVEIVSFAHGLAADPMSWRPVVLDLQ